MESPRPRALYERLVAVFESESDEKLARDLDIPLRSLSRLKANDGTGPRWDRTIRLLRLAGWLRAEEELPPAEELRRQALEERAAQLRRRLEEESGQGG